MYELLVNYEVEMETKEISIDDKINILFESKLLIPITDEFLRFHKESEKYDKILNNKNITDKIRKENTKIKYIITKINKVADIYNIVNTNNIANIEEIDKLLYPSLAYRKVVIINEIEELFIISKIINQGKTLSVNEYYEDLLNYRKYPYINFKDANRNSFQFRSNETKTAIRYCNFEFMDQTKYPTQYKNYLQVRTIGKENIVEIVGVAINPMKFEYATKKNRDGMVCVKLNNTLELSRNKNNGYLSTLSVLKKQISEDLNFKILPYWIFDKENDKIKIQSYENLSNLNH